MELVKANPDPETLKMFIWILVGVFTLSVTIIGFFLKRELKEVKIMKDQQKTELKSYTEAQDKKWSDFEIRQKEYYTQQHAQIDKLETLVNTVCSSVQNINTIIEVLKRLDDERNPRIEKQVLEHERRLTSFGQELVYIKAKIGNGFKENTLTN